MKGSGIAHRLTLTFGLYLVVGLELLQLKSTSHYVLMHKHTWVTWFASIHRIAAYMLTNEHRGKS